MVEPTPTPTSSDFSSSTDRGLHAASRNRSSTDTSAQIVSAGQTDCNLLISTESSDQHATDRNGSYDSYPKDTSDRSSALEQHINPSSPYPAGWQGRIYKSPLHSTSFPHAALSDNGATSYRVNSGEPCAPSTLDSHPQSIAPIVSLRKRSHPTHQPHRLV